MEVQTDIRPELSKLFCSLVQTQTKVQDEMTTTYDLMTEASTQADDENYQRIQQKIRKLEEKYEDIKEENEAIAAMRQARRSSSRSRSLSTVKETECQKKLHSLAKAVSLCRTSAPNKPSPSKTYTLSKSSTCTSEFVNKSESLSKTSAFSSPQPLREKANQSSNCATCNDKCTDSSQDFCSKLSRMPDGESKSSLFRSQYGSKSSTCASQHGNQSAKLGTPECRDSVNSSCGAPENFSKSNLSNISLSKSSACSECMDKSTSTDHRITKASSLSKTSTVSKASLGRSSYLSKSSLGKASSAFSTTSSLNRTPFRSVQECKNDFLKSEEKLSKGIGNLKKNLRVMTVKNRLMIMNLKDNVEKIRNLREQNSQLHDLSCSAMECSGMRKYCPEKEDRMNATNNNTCTCFIGSLSRPELCSFEQEPDVKRRKITPEEEFVDLALKVIIDDQDQLSLNLNSLAEGDGFQSSNSCLKEDLLDFVDWVDAHLLQEDKMSASDIRTSTPKQKAFQPKTSTPLGSPRFSQPLAFESVISPEIVMQQTFSPIVPVRTLQPEISASRSIHTQTPCKNSDFQDLVPLCSTIKSDDSSKFLCNDFEATETSSGDDCDEEANIAFCDSPSEFLENATNNNSEIKAVEDVRSILLTPEQAQWAQDEEAFEADFVSRTAVAAIICGITVIGIVCYCRARSE